QSFALVCDDPDAPHGTFTHWVLYNLPAAARELPPDVRPEFTLRDGARQGLNDSGRIGYSGPAPPPGPAHRYFFKLYALDGVLRPAAGCGTEPPAAANTHEPNPRPALFDPSRCGRVEGRVTWAGPILELPPFLFGIPKTDGSFEMRMMPNPNRPEVDRDSRGV